MAAKYTSFGTRRISTNPSRARLLGGLVVISLIAGTLGPVATVAASPTQATPSPKADKPSKSEVKADLQGLPLYFVANEGQADKRVDYYVQGSKTNVYFTSKGITYQLSDGKAKRRWAVKLNFKGANRVTPVGRAQTDATINYFKGSKEDWTNSSTYSRLVYENLWDGIDLVYSGTANELKYSFIVHPGADPSDIDLSYQGADSVRLNRKGDIKVSTPVSSFTDTRPYTFQKVGDHRSRVSSSYELESAHHRRRSYGFNIGGFDPTKRLVIDPAVLVYAGFIGGSGSDNADGIAVDSSGAAYVTGYTSSTEATFPETGGPDLTHNVSFDAFVAKVAPNGSSLTYAGFIGGSGGDWGWDIAVDTSGAAYVAGQTTSSEATFPETVGPDLTYNGGFDGFVAKVAPNGSSLIYAGYIGGSDTDSAYGIAVDASGAAYVAGGTRSTEASFPETVGPDLTHNGGITEAFVAKVATNGATLTYAGYIGGSGNEGAGGIAVDSSGAAYVTGNTDSTEATFPETGGPDLTHNGGADGFVAKVATNGTTLTYAGYIGGNGTDQGADIAVDSSGAAYVAGHTNSFTGFPAAGGPDLTTDGSNEAFVAKVVPSGSSLAYAGYIGGSAWDIGTGIAVDSTGAAYVSGWTESTSSTFPETGGPDLTDNGLADAFVAKVTPTGSALTYAGFIGGSGFDNANAIALDSSGAAYISGYTTSTEATFPEVGGPDLSHNGGSEDAFVVKVREIQTLTVTKTGSGNGTVTGPGINCGTDGSQCTMDYSHGQVIALSAGTGANSTFAGWSGACTGTSTACHLTMDQARSVTATFTLINRTLTVVKAGNGNGTITGTGISCGTGNSDCTETYPHGTLVELSANPGANSTFASWSGACTGTGACNVTMDQAKSVTATFTLVNRTLTVDKAGTGAGNVTGQGITCGTNGVDCTEDYPHGTMVSLTATPGANSTFAQWSGACSGTGACNVTMDQARSVTATFTLVNRTLTVAKAGTGNGTVTGTGINCGTGNTDCTEDYPHGTVVELSANPGANSTFVEWTGACGGPGSCNILMSQAHSVTATFTLENRTLTAAKAGTGNGTVTGTGINCGTGNADCTEAYPHGTEVALTANPGANSTFVEWSGACSGTGACNVTMDQARSVTATFALVNRTLTVDKAGAGTVTGTGIDCGTATTDCTEDYPHGTVVELSAAPGANSTFTGWSGDCGGTGSCSVTMNQVRSVTATFTLENRTLNVVKGGNGNGTITGTGIDCGTETTDCTDDYPHGTLVELSAAPGANSTFTGWSGDCSGTDACSVTMDQARSVTANFTLENRTLNVTTAGNGTGTVTGNGIDCGTETTDCTEDYPHGEIISLVATAGVNSIFIEWDGACSGTAECDVTMDGLNEVSATFLPAGPHVVVAKINSTKHVKVNGKRKLKLAGRLTVSDDVGDCIEIVKVTIQRKAGRKWVLWKTATTKSSGKFAVAGSDKAGSYRVKYKKKTLQHAPGKETICTGALSKIKKHSH